jgi:ParB-like chromosome segregation protein Spo0J
MTEHEHAVIDRLAGEQSPAFLTTRGMASRMTEKTMLDPFNPKTGALAENIRDIIGGDDTELRNSLRQFGWHAELPALVDEHGVTIVGHRRLKIAKELMIEPVIKTITFGIGNVADAERVKLALVSNLGAKPLTKADRQRLAEYLYGKREWTMEQIAKALNVSTKQVSRDLEGFDMMSKPSRPKGGRPKQAQRISARLKLADARKEKIVELGKQGLSAKAIAAEVGVVDRRVSLVLEHERIRRDAQAEIVNSIEVSRDDLSPTARGKFDILERRLRAEMEFEIAKQVDAKVKALMTEALSYQSAKDRETLEQANVLISHFSGRSRPALTAHEYTSILLRALHPDTSTFELRLEAFKLVNKKKLLLRDDGPIVLAGAPLPKTLEEMIARRKLKRPYSAP